MNLQNEAFSLNELNNKINKGEIKYEDDEYSAPHFWGIKFKKVPRKVRFPRKMRKRKKML